MIYQASEVNGLLGTAALLNSMYNVLKVYKLNKLFGNRAITEGTNST